MSGVKFFFYMFFFSMYKMIYSFEEKESINGRVGAQNFDISFHDRKQMILKLENLNTKLQQILKKSTKRKSNNRLWKGSLGDITKYQICNFLQIFVKFTIL